MFINNILEACKGTITAVKSIRRKAPDYKANIHAPSPLL